jgi:hypothetical protein
MPVETRHFEQAPRVDRPPPDLCCATPGSLPATQGQRSADLIVIGEAMVETALRSTISEWTRYSYLSYLGLKIIHHDFATGQ